MLLRTRWRDAKKLDRVRPGETYLNNPKVRELVLTGNGQGQSNDYLLNLAGIINNYGLNAADITRLLTTLRDQAQTFPTDQKDKANDTLNDLERGLAEEQPDPGRIGRRLKKLVALATAVSGDMSTFTSNVIELTEQLGIPIDQVQLP
ncbi:hypothetical protein [Leptothoe sp. PORK10 BA2]|uniref:hypothetical protein n=1 Tax=Leptothoe sp. PORK10 BA2 TaxID=3110254 RepID=UPI002B21AE21|nr:hypothetical protein [Leptothoe sp. PORK10 BA2]MEA5466432.1 hypothetical protein [Leptothoe sp. PORK10 BA2]